MPAFNLRGIEPEIMAQLKDLAKNQHISVNLLILQLIERGLGYSVKEKKITYHELDNLSATWSKEDIKNFEKDTRYFEQIDEGLWK